MVVKERLLMTIQNCINSVSCLAQLIYAAAGGLGVAADDDSELHV